MPERTEEHRVRCLACGATASDVWVMSHAMHEDDGPFTVVIEHRYVTEWRILDAPQDTPAP